jgi:hypothetical protein
MSLISRFFRNPGQIFYKAIEVPPCAMISAINEEPRSKLLGIKNFTLKSLPL